MTHPGGTSQGVPSTVLTLAKAYALAGAREEAAAIRNGDVRLFTDVRAAIQKILNPDSGRGGSGGVEVDTAIGQLGNEAVAADELVDAHKAGRRRHTRELDSLRRLPRLRGS